MPQTIEELTQEMEYRIQSFGLPPITTKDKMPLRYTDNFKKDISEGEKAQYLVRDILLNIHKNKITDINCLNKDGKYDIKCKFSGIEHTLEVKDDYASHWTTNVAIEYESWGKLSGIYTTQAHWWVHQVRGVFFIIPVIKVLEMIDRKLYSDVYHAIHLDSANKFYLFNIITFCENCKKLEEETFNGY